MSKLDVIGTGWLNFLMLNKILFSVIENYLTLIDTIEEGVDVYSFWHNNSGIFPELSTVAFQILPAPSTSSACERDFSFASLFTESRRANISPENLNAKILLAANKDINKLLDPILF